MKKLIVALSLVATYLSLVPQAHAVTIFACPASASGFNPLCSISFQGVVQTLVTTLFIIAIIIALFYLIWGGLKWLTSGGDKSAVQSAREHIVAAIIGLVIIFLSYFILTIVLNFFGLGTGFNWVLPIVP